MVSKADSRTGSHSPSEIWKKYNFGCCISKTTDIGGRGYHGKKSPSATIFKLQQPPWFLGGHWLVLSFSYLEQGLTYFLTERCVYFLTESCVFFQPSPCGHARLLDRKGRQRSCSLSHSLVIEKHGSSFSPFHTFCILKTAVRLRLCQDPTPRESRARKLEVV